MDERMPLVDRFHADPEINIFLISTMAGGVGLNLTGANKVRVLVICASHFSETRQTGRHI